MNIDLVYPREHRKQMERKDVVTRQECRTEKQGMGLRLRSKVENEHEDDGQTDGVEQSVTGHATMAQESGCTNSEESQGNETASEAQRRTGQVVGSGE